MDVRSIVKTFPGVQALDGVDLKVKRGEVHALVGENGAGKSTLMLVLGGVYKPDKGEIFLEGKKVQFETPSEANINGISIVYQELSLVQNMSVAENIFANRQPVNKFNLIKSKELMEKTSEILSLFNMQNLRPDTLVKDLSVANQQVIEILKAMSFNPKVLILDEPTSSLTEVEVKQLFQNIRILKERGITFIYISHHLSEIFDIADTVTVLRDGKHVCDAVVKDIDEEFLITKMVGRTIGNIYGRRSLKDQIGEEVFRAENLTKKDVFQDVNFSVRKGEIVGFAGLVGAGRTEIGRAIFGAEPFDSGNVYLEGKKVNAANTHQAITRRIGYMTEDRKSQGLYLNSSLLTNLISNRLYDFTKNGFIAEKRTVDNACENIKDFRIITPDIYQLVGNLSGGNQQKVLLSIWFGIKPKFLIVDEPTRGVDIGAKSEIYILLRKLAASGVAIMMISSDLSEILGVSDRIFVVKDGRIAGVLNQAEAAEDKVIALAAGSGAQKGECL